MGAKGGGALPWKEGKEMEYPTFVMEAQEPISEKKRQSREKTTEKKLTSRRENPWRKKNTTLHRMENTEGHARKRAQAYGNDLLTK